jgi:hypothetical protein
MKRSWIFIISAAVIVVLALYGTLILLAPEKLVIEQSVRIYAPKNTVFKHIICFNSWKKWGFWFQFDPLMEFEHSDNNCGSDASMNWFSQSSGNGHLSIRHLIPDSSVMVNISNEALPGLSTVEWSMHSDSVSTNLNCKFAGVSQHFLIRPLNLVYSSVLEEAVNVTLNNLKREVEKNPFNGIKEYEYLYKIERVHVKNQQFLILKSINKENEFIPGLKWSLEEVKKMPFSDQHHQVDELVTLGYNSAFNEMDDLDIRIGVQVENQKYPGEKKIVNVEGGMAFFIEGSSNEHRRLHEVMVKYLIDNGYKVREPVFVRFRNLKNGGLETATVQVNYFVTE